jgi:hypothetical protein
MSSLRTSSRLYSGRILGYSVPTLNAILYIMSKRWDDLAVVYQTERS